MLRLCALLVLGACGARTARPLDNAAHARTLQCDDKRSDGVAMTFYVSDDDRDPRPVDDSFDATWKRETPQFDRCTSSNTSREAQSVVLRFHVSTAGAVIEAATSGPDAAVDRCACEVLFGLAFPAQSRPVFAVLAVEVPAAR